MATIRVKAHTRGGVRIKAHIRQVKGRSSRSVRSRASRSARGALHWIDRARTESFSKSRARHRKARTPRRGAGERAAIAGGALALATGVTVLGERTVKSRRRMKWHYPS